MAKKIQHLKEQAYRLAGVKTTKALKRVHNAIAQLDMRLKTSWVRTIEILENLAQGIPIWDGNGDSIDATINKLLNYQAQLMNEMSEVALHQVSIAEEFII